MWVRIGSLTLFLLATVLTNASAQTRSNQLEIENPPSGALSREQLTTIARDIRRLEQHPLAPDARRAHRLLFTWVQGSPDVHISLCNGVIGPLLESDSPYHAELLGQFILSSAAYAIENPAQASDPVRVNLGGVEGALRSYEALKEHAGDAVRDNYMEKLLKLEEKGKLEAFLSKRQKTC
jgi:hypothetical protein